MSEVLLTAQAVLTMDAVNTVIVDGAVLVRDDKIAEVGEAAELSARYPEAKRKDFGKAVLLPGLVNTHMHSGILRGTAEGLPLWDWLRLFIDPMHRVLRPEEAEASSWLCYGESLLAGTTTAVDMWRFMYGSAKAAEQLGLRVVMVPYVGEEVGFDYFDNLDDNEKLIQEWHGKANGRINVWVGLEHQFYVDEAACKRAIDMCARYGVGLHTHSNESRDEVKESYKRYGISPIKALKNKGILDIENVLLAHCVWLEDEEIALLRDNGIGVAHNPTSNMKIASGPAPVVDMIKAGIAVGIGSDGEKENNNLDIFEEMKIASILAKLRGMNAAAYDAWDVLRSATIEGARAIGMADRIGSLEVGKQADIVAVRADGPHMTPFIKEGPFFNLHHNIVHAVQGGDVLMTMVDGFIAAENGVLTAGDMQQFIADAEKACADVIERRTKWLKDNEQGALSPV
ncbi:amidohydrolase [Parvibaculum sp.]|uniref:amidohydrolase family protein n=1 Tax=Parvibaculum sp. TaxID=2024848 RepID=UPI00320DE1B9